MVKIQEKKENILSTYFITHFVQNELKTKYCKIIYFFTFYEFSNKNQKCYFKNILQI